MAHKGSMNTRQQETSYKLLMHWYNTPDRLHKWDNQRSEMCWRCHQETGTLTHIWWQCNLIKDYWKEVRNLIKLITDTNLNLNAACCLIHVTNFSLKRYKHSLTKHLLNAAKSLIPLHWNSSRVPSTSEWLLKTRDICEMEDTLAQERGNVERFHKTWQPWFSFRYSQTYEDIVNNKPP